MKHGRLVLAAGMAVAAAVVPASVAHADAPACTTTFRGAISTAWELPGNWDNGVPTSTSVACWGDSQMVVVSTAGQTAWIVRGGELDVTGGSFALADPPAGVASGSSTLNVFVQDGGTSSGASSQVHVADHAEWSGASVVRLPMGGGSLVVDGTGPTEIDGSMLEYWSSITLTNPDFRTGGSPTVLTPGPVAFGPGVLVEHVGPGTATFGAGGESTGQMTGPATGDFGFVSDTFVGAVNVAADATFHAGTIKVHCTASHGGAAGCSSITGSGTIVTSRITGAFADATQSVARVQDIKGSAIVLGSGTLHLVGPSVIDGGMRLDASASSSGIFGRLDVSGGPVTFGGVPSVTPTDGFTFAPGEVFTLITDGQGVERSGDLVDPASGFSVRTTASSYALVRSPSTSTQVPNHHGSCAAPGGPRASKVSVKAGARIRLTGQVVLACEDTVPYHGRPVPKRTRVDLTPRGKRAFLPGKLIGYLAVDPNQHVHGWATIPKKTKPGAYAIHVYGASKVLAIVVR